MPELLRAEWGYPISLGGERDPVVPVGAEARAEHAVRSCPAHGSQARTAHPWRRAPPVIAPLTARSAPSAATMRMRIWIAAPTDHLVVAVGRVGRRSHPQRPRRRGASATPSVIQRPISKIAASATTRRAADLNGATPNLAGAQASTFG
ncbi:MULTISPECIES: hypothetical protein [Actinomycetes]|uniref:Uncharacterized protein n=1 Tax=Rhodococcus qingshengii JCM 15477 TaxID=1303681 RepID=A0AB38RNW7_RHOSG|nr:MULTISPECIES: hypothetical protein [Rhodococcus]UPU46916.1 hypothetical protein M0639_34355 [Rhodococcus qingshengii JCM 15477]